MDNIDKPNYYVAKLSNGSEVECWDLICALGLGPALANVLKYVWRAGKKDGQSYVKDLQKARKYIDLELARISDCPIQRGFSASSRPSINGYTGPYASRQDEEKHRHKNEIRDMAGI